MELVFLALLILLMATALASGYPVAFALPGSAILTILTAATLGTLVEGNMGAYFAQGDPIQWLNAGVTNFRGIYWEPERDTLIAIPLFVFMGIMLERSKIAEDLLVTMAQLFGPIPGGLGMSVVFVGALLAATTGIVGATVIAMGLISLPVMLRANYSRPLATGTIAASGTLGQIIPPSIVLIILADQLSSATDQAATLRTVEYKAGTGQSVLPSEFNLTSTSAGDMFLGAFLPGLVLVGLYAAFILTLALIRPKVAPPVHYEGKYDTKFMLRVAVVLVPPLTLIFVVLGSIILGIATVNQAGAIGAIGAMIMAGYRLTAGRQGAYTPAILAAVSVAVIIFLLHIFDINVRNIRGTEDVIGITLAAVAVVVLLVAIGWSGWRVHKIDRTLEYVMVETAKTSSLVFIILLGAAMLTAAFRAFGGEDLVKDFLSGLPGGFITKFVVVMAVIFVLGFFLDFIEIAVVVVPIISPILLADPSANVTAVWLGVMIGVNMQTSFLTPPFGFALFYLRGVAPPIVRTIEIYRGVVPFILLQLVGLTVVGVFPALVNFLPSWVSLTSETAPPPRNPRLQACLEEYVFNIYDERGDSLRASIDNAAAMDLGLLPDKPRSSMAEGLKAARATFDLVAEVRAAEAALEAYLPEYEPLHRQVRRLQLEIHDLGEEMVTERSQFDRLARSGAAGPDDRRSLEDRIAALKSEQERLRAEIPPDWQEARKRYVDLSGEVENARLAYRRNVDDAYDQVAEVRALIGQSDALAAVRKAFENLRASVANDPPEQAVEAVKAVETELQSIQEISDIRSKLSAVRKALAGDTPDRVAASAPLQEALGLYAAEAAWRTRAASALAAGLEEYDNAIRGSIGVRSQERLTSDQAKEIAACLSHHRDISLHF